MAQAESQSETFEEFKRSFSYGARSNMNFKFLKNLSNEDAGEFFKQLLQKLGESFDNGDLRRLHQFIVEWQARGYAARGNYAYDDTSFTPLQKPIAQSRVTLLTSSGHFVEGHDPEPFGIKKMTQQQCEQLIDDFLKSEPTLSSIPIDTPRDHLRVRHGGYDIHGAQTDPNVVFALERLREIQQEGMIGALAEEAYSFVGATAQTRLLKHAGPEWVKLFKQKHVDAALLVPV
ncbi:MAG: hypothetical protein HY782_22325 [Chloroflexi bacterium]|nr:hypothetical protein [Chloroflexota bacterium]